MLYHLFSRFLNYIKYPHCHKITNQIFLGDYKSSQNTDFLKKNKINIILNCTTNLKNNKNIKTYRIAIEDDLKILSILKMKKMLPLINHLIDYHINNGDIILINCRAGMQRSATIVASFLMYKYGLTKNQAVSYIESIRYIAFKIFPHFYFSI